MYAHIYTEKEKEEKKTRQDNMVFRKIFKNKRDSSGRTDDDEGSIVISYDDRYDVLVTSALKNCDYDAAFTTSSPITTAAAAPSNNTANKSYNEDERQMDDDDDADWDTTIHVNENKYKATTTSTSTSTGSNNEYTTTYSSWLTSCLNCV